MKADEFELTCGFTQTLCIQEVTDVVLLSSPAVNMTHNYRSRKSFCE